ncbi:MAG: hypothetical protein QF672_10785, partial [SAR202 cluster bacterium]|nr:hypothetical protein [SAR202 cluster bacterium]
MDSTYHDLNETSNQPPIRPAPNSQPADTLSQIDKARQMADTLISELESSPTKSSEVIQSALTLEERHSL